MGTKVNIDGTVMGPNQARISVFDRGFLYGDSVYEVMRTYEGLVFAMDQHLDRLQRSADSLGIRLPNRAWLATEIQHTLEAAENPESALRLMVTRGSGPMTLDPTFARSPICVILVRPFEAFPARLFEEGLRLAVPGVRHNLRASKNPAVKSGNYLNSVLALGEARKQGCDDALLLNAQGLVAEATSANVFAWRAGQLCTPPLATGLLEGVTRGLLLNLARRAGMDCVECELTLEELQAAEEVMLTSTMREVMPVVQIDSRPVGSGRPGPISQRLKTLFHDHAIALVRQARPR